MYVGQSLQSERCMPRCSPFTSCLRAKQRGFSEAFALEADADLLSKNK